MNNERLVRLETDLDCRLADLWKDASNIEEWTLAIVAAFMRAAYGAGFCDALREDDPLAFFSLHGFHPPERKAA